MTDSAPISTRLPLPAKTVIRYWFACRHRGDLERKFARNSITDGQFWLRTFAGKRAWRGRV